MIHSKLLLRPLGPLALLVPCVALAPAHAQTTWFVDVGHPGPGQGTAGDPYSSLQYAIDQPTTLPGDTLQVSPGTYVENVTLGSKQLVVIASGGPAVTSIRAAGPGPVVTLADSAGVPIQPRFEGFTVRGGQGPGIVQPPNGFGLVRRVVVRDCAGAGVFNDYDLTLDQVTLTGNGIGLENTGLGVLWNTRALVVWGNAVEAAITPYFGAPIVDSIIPPGVNVGSGTLYADPLFWNAAKGDVHLGAGSPAIQAGADWGAFEFDAQYAPPVAVECQTAPNSVGPGALIDWSGDTSISGAEFTLLASGAPSGNFALFFYGPESVQLPFGDGFRCVGGGGLGIFRLPPLITDAAGSGQTLLEFDAPPVGEGPGAITPGTSWTFQFYYRDPIGPLGTGFNLSDAVRADFLP